MRGKEVFYPIGWDDNGLPTERRVQNYYHVRCDPSLGYDPAFVPPASPGTDQVPVSRRNFVELCQRLTDLDEQAFEEVWRRLGLSVDWSMMYRTIDTDSRAISQRAFLRNLASGEAYLAEAPTLWDVTFQHRGRPGRSRGPGGRRGLLPDRVPPRATARWCRSRRPAPNCSPRAWRWSRIRATGGTRR